MQQRQQQREFTRRLADEGYDEVVTMVMPPRPEVAIHSHPYAVKALVIAGEITLGVSGMRTTYRPGETFALAAGCQHTEYYGTDGVTYVVGRKQR